MRLSAWTDDMVRLMRDACEQSSYYDELAEAIGRALGGVQTLHLCDAGCGLGYLSLALARRCRRVTAVERAPKALAVLSDNLQRRGVSNVELLRQDAWALPADMRFDAMIFCLFGRLEDALQLASMHAQRAVIVKRSHPARRFALDAEETAPDSAEPARALLRAKGLRYAEETLRLSLNQPFRSMDDARLFFRLYARRDAMADVDEASVRARLLPGSSPEFPFVLPAARDLTLLTVECKAYD